MKLDNLYSLRRNFTIIGLTGRIGSGCTSLSESLSKSFDEFNNIGLRDPEDSNYFSDEIFERKYNICKSYLSHNDNWTPFKIIRYKKVLLLYILNKYGGNHTAIKEILDRFFNTDKKDKNSIAVKRVLIEINKLDKENKNLILEIKSLNLQKIESKKDLRTLHEIFFGKEYLEFSNKLFSAFEANGYLRRTRLFHFAACNIRQYGDPLPQKDFDNINYIYSIAYVINRIIKAIKQNNKEKPTKIVIDSLRNSLEIMFFRERYSAFYMIATKDILNNAQRRLDERLVTKIEDKDERQLLVNQIIDLDNTEYKTSDFNKGTFSSPDVENCIQKSDFHIFNLKKSQIGEFLKKYNQKSNNNFLSREEQLMKFLSLLMQPGIITPSSSERCMQIAYTAKLNSGCISRQVGAAITDNTFSIKSIGWNDIPKGHTPCNLRSVEDFLKDKEVINESHYSNFERGVVSSITEYKYKNGNPSNFKEALIDYYKKPFEQSKNDLNGKNCSFCFKSIHNHYEKEKNQVHTRSLHAEENAMLQLAKYGTTGIKNGYLFTTASPCELCSKKAYQLGIKFIYFIDPYPGISSDQILSGGKDANRPVILPFSGAIGNAYHKLYEPFLSYKDEISMTLELI